jgi:hypothetical protein
MDQRRASTACAALGRCICSFGGEDALAGSSSVESNVMMPLRDRVT